MYIPNLSARVAPSGFVRPSGAAALPSQVGKVQAILAWLGHLPKNRNVITGRQDAATKAAVRLFEDNYNREQIARNYRFSPRSVTVDDGTIGPQVIAAAQNYDASAASQGYGMGITVGEIAAVTAAAPSIDAAEIVVHQDALPIAPRPPAPPLAGTPPTQQTASKFSTGPVVAVGVGIAVIALAVAYKRSHRKGR